SLLPCETEGPGTPYLIPDWNGRGKNRAAPGGFSSGGAALLRQCLERQPPVQKQLQPLIDGVIMDQPALEMRLARLGAGKRKPVRRPDRPAMHHRQRHLRVELNAE